MTTPQTFEKAFERLEHILEALNSGKPSLEEAIKLYEEADSLVRDCHKKLTEAEKKIEVLIKSRQGQLQTDASGQPQTTQG